MGSAGEDDETVRQFRVSGFVPIPHGDLFAGCGDLSHIELNECYGDLSPIDQQLHGFRIADDSEG